MGFFDALGKIANPISAVTDVVGSIASPFIQRKQQKRQIAAAKEQQERQNKFNLDMWKMQADYNSPEQQVKRMKDANLNPALAMGNISSGSMASAPEQNVADTAALEGAQTGVFANTIQNVVDSMLDVQKKVLDLQSVKEDIKGKDVNNRFQNASFLERLEQLRNNNAKTLEDIAAVRKNLELMRLEGQLKEFSIKTLLPQQAKINDSQIKKIDQEVDNLVLTSQIMDEQLSQAKSETDRIKVYNQYIKQLSEFKRKALADGVDLDNLDWPHLVYSMAREISPDGKPFKWIASLLKDTKEKGEKFYNELKDGKIVKDFIRGCTPDMPKNYWDKHPSGAFRH